MQLIDNINERVGQNLAQSIRKGSKLSIAAACFSIYAYRELRKQLREIDELRFIFTSPTFVAEQTPKEAREFYIPRLCRERGICGTAFEVKLRNELTQQAVAKECADWLRRKATFKSNVTNERMMGFLNVDDETYMPLNGFTTVDLGCARGNNIYYPVQKMNRTENAGYYLRLFDQLWGDKVRFQDVTDAVIAGLSAAYRENAPEFIYFFALYNIFHEFLEDVSEDELPNEATGFRESQVWKMLYNFQRDAVLAIIGKLEKFNGCILADSVGLGKTLTALAVVKYYGSRNKTVLVLCPKKLAANWNTYKGNYVNNPLAKDRLRYDVLFHTDLSRDHGESNGLDLERLNWGNYDLVVIDESHNFRNGGELSGAEARENRYQRLMNHVIRTGVKTKVLMLSATPVNNRFADLRNQLELAYEGDVALINAQLGTARGVGEIFRQAQTAFNAWNKLPAAQRTTDALLRSLDFDFFTLLDSLTIARSRKHIEKYYETSEIGKFPARRPPVSLRPRLTDRADVPNYGEIYSRLMALNLAIYTPSDFIHPSKVAKYQGQAGDGAKANLTQSGREAGIRRLMGINLLKRLESSVQAFRLTLDRVQAQIRETVETIHNYESGSRVVELTEVSADAADLDADDQNADIFAVGRKVRIDLADMDWKTWLKLLEADAAKLGELSSLMAQINPAHDVKLQTLLDLIREKVAHPLNPGNRKVLVFTAFSDTADYLYANIANAAKARLGLDTAEITGTIDGRTTVPRLRADLNTILTCFAPRAKGRDVLMPGRTDEIDILIATDCISEGQNLQDCDYVVNYDIHWNPVRIIQRFGRVDRIGSPNDSIQLVNFWPDVDLDEYINLKERVESRMKLSVLTSTGDENPIDAEEKGDLEYRRAQLKRLQTEVVDIEDMASGVSIQDLGLNEFRLDLLAYLKRHGGDVESAPKGLHAVVEARPDAPPGAIFILRNVNDSVNAGDRNRIHPFYMVYVDEAGAVVRNHLDPKKLLDTVRLLCRGKAEPCVELCRRFNAETDDGRRMEAVSALLGKAVESIVAVKAESDIDSLFSAGGTTALLGEVSGLDDFELICFLVVKEGEKCA